MAMTPPIRLIEKHNLKIGLVIRDKFRFFEDFISIYLDFYIVLKYYIKIQFNSGAKM